MKTFKRLLTILLIFVILINTNLTAFANNNTNSSYKTQNSEYNKNITITNTGIYINDDFYSQKQFIQLLDTAQEVQHPQTRSAIALVAGTWFIPGVGEVVITAAGIVMVAGTVVAAGSWIYNTITKWFTTRAFNKSAQNALNNCNNNKKHHILNKKHNWHKLNKEPNWDNISPILLQVLKKGYEKKETGSQYIRSLIYKGETVVVRFIKDTEGLIKYISTAWCE